MFEAACDLTGWFERGEVVSEEAEYIEDGVHLSNKACRHCYMLPHIAPHVGIPGRAGSCTCPKDRCWYSEQVGRRAIGLKAIAPESWPTDSS